jgi:hypothetical protein
MSIWSVIMLRHCMNGARRERGCFDARIPARDYSPNG